MRICTSFYWNHTRQDVIDFIKHCVICQQTKAVNISPYGLL